MSDTIPNHDDTNEAQTASHSAATTPAATASPAPIAAPVTVRWWQHRVPLVITGAALLLGCILGVGAGAIGAFAVNDGHDGDNRGHSARDHRDDGRGGDGRDGDGSHDGDNRNQTVPAPSTSASTIPSAPSAPSPTAS
jgi:hypothetical protein